MSHPPPTGQTTPPPRGRISRFAGRRQEALIQLVHSVMLSAEPGSNTSRARNRGTVPHLRNAQPNAPAQGLSKCKKCLSCRLFSASNRLRNTTKLTKISCGIAATSFSPASLSCDCEPFDRRLRSGGTKPIRWGKPPSQFSNMSVRPRLVCPATLL